MAAFAGAAAAWRGAPARAEVAAGGPPPRGNPGRFHGAGTPAAAMATAHDQDRFTVPRTRRRRPATHEAAA
ncbi:MAG: hypothetical protein MZW92_34995 [Comamonadaceae bacterium]|nr:hypothetical protein [Comamonadaceae bacterium]